MYEINGFKISTMEDAKKLNGLDTEENRVLQSEKKAYVKKQGIRRFLLVLFFGIMVATYLQGGVL